MNWEKQVGCYLVSWDRSQVRRSEKQPCDLPCCFLAEESFGSMDLVSQSATQWQEVLRSPNAWMDFTLVLHSNKENFKS